MSVKAASEFIERLHSDADFADAVADATEIEARTNVVRDAGYVFTQDHLDEAVAQHAPGAELSDEQLEAVAGGAMTFASPGAMQSMGLVGAGGRLNTSALSGLFGSGARDPGTVAGVSVFE